MGQFGRMASFRAVAKLVVASGPTPLRGRPVWRPDWELRSSSPEGSHPTKLTHRREPGKIAFSSQGSSVTPHIRQRTFLGFSEVRNLDDRGGRSGKGTRSRPTAHTNHFPHMLPPEPGSKTPTRGPGRRRPASPLLLGRANAALLRRTVQLGTANRKVETEIKQRKVAEQSLRTSESHLRKLLLDAHGMQRKLRQISHQILIAQEDGMRDEKISGAFKASPEAGAGTKVAAQVPFKHHPTQGKSP